MPLSHIANLYKSDGRVAAPPSLDQVLINRWPGNVSALEESTGPLVVTLLGDTGAQISHLIPGDQVHFGGSWVGSEFEADQAPLHLNPHRLKFFATVVLSMSRPPPPRNERTKPKEASPRFSDVRINSEYEQWLTQRRKRKARPLVPPESKPQLGSEKPSEQYEAWLRDKRKGPGKPPITPVAVSP
jgi:hypothetical protein